MFVKVGVFNATKEQMFFIKGRLMPKTQHCVYDIILMI